MIIRPRRGEAQVAAAYSQPPIYEIGRQFDLGSGDAARQSIEGDRRYIRSWAPGTAGTADIIAKHGGWAHANQRGSSSDPGRQRHRSRDHVEPLAPGHLQVPRQGLHRGRAGSPSGAV